jgi:hypothetical protein
MSRDYFLRMVDQVAALLEEIDQRQRSGDNSGAKAELNSRCEEFLGLDIPQIQRMSPEAVADFLNTAGGLRQSRSITLAALLLKDAEIHAADTRRVMIDRVHAFCLLADNIDQLDLDDQRAYQPMLREVAKQLLDFREHPYIGEKLRKFDQKNALVSPP